MKNPIVILGLIFSIPGQLLASEPLPPLNEQTVVERLVSLSRLGKISQLNAAIAESEALKARSPYDHTFSLTGSHQIDASEKVFSVFGDRTDTTNITAKLQRAFPTGTQAEVGYKTSRSKTDSTFVALNPSYDSAWFVGLRQPLWRDSFGSSMRNQIKAAEANVDAAKARSIAEIRNIVFQGLREFWTWIAWVEDEKVAVRGVKRASDFLSITRKKVRLGTAEKADLYAAQASLASRQQDVLLASERSRNALTRLRNVLLLDSTTPVTSTEKLTYTKPPIALEDSLNQALSSRSEIKAAEKELAAAKNTWHSQRSASRPQLDFFTQLTMNDVDGDWPGSAGGAFGSSDPNWTVGGELTIPFENKLLKADRKTSELRSRIFTLQLEQTRQEVLTEVQLAWDTLVATQAQSKKATRVEELQRKKLAEEEKDFRRGRSDAFTVLIYQQDLIASERQKLAALAKEAIAQKSLSLATGGLLTSIEGSK